MHPSPTVDVQLGFDVSQRDTEASQHAGALVDGKEYMFAADAVRAAALGFYEGTLQHVFACGSNGTRAGSVAPAGGSVASAVRSISASERPCAVKQ